MNNDEIKYCPYCGHDLNGFQVKNIIENNDDSYKDAVELVIQSGKASSALIQRRLRVGYARAARFLDKMENDGIVSPADGAKPRMILIKK